MDKLSLLLPLGLLACEPQPGDSVADTSWSLDLVEVPAGAFLMGCDPDVDPACEDDELPQREVTLAAFTILRTEVSHAAWQACEDDGACEPPLLPSDLVLSPQLPVTGITYLSGEAFCAWAGLRLPTEAEWEKAARGDDGRLYPWGDAEPACDLAHGRGCDEPLLPVDSLEAGASPYGVLHTSGNAWEWVSDGYAHDYYEEAPSEDPPGPEGSSLQLLRGVAVYSSSDALRVSNRQVAVPGMTCPMCGLRCAGDAP